MDLSQLEENDMTNEEAAVSMLIAILDDLRSRLRDVRPIGLTKGADVRVNKAMAHLRLASKKLQEALALPMVMPYPNGVKEAE